MNELRLTLDIADRNRFNPGEKLTGKAGWKLDKTPKAAEIRLFWFTQGIGTRDVEVVETIVLQQPCDIDEQSFSIRLPRGPYTFSGSLISLQWGLDLVVSPGDLTQHIDFDLSPFDDPIVLQKVADPKNKGFSISVGS